MELLLPITEEQENRCLEEIGYTRSQLCDDLQHIKGWLKEQHHLPPSRLKEKDEFLTMYLTGCKGNLERVKSKLDAYYTFRSQTGILSDRDPLNANYASVMDAFCYCVLPRTTEIGQRIVFCTLTKNDSTSFIHAEYNKKVFHVTELYMRMDNCMIGILAVVDLKNMTLGLLWKLKLRLIRDGVHFLQNVMPFRVSGIYFVNVPYALELFLNNVVIPLTSKKISKRVYVTSKGVEDLSQFIDITLLPKDCGGKEGSINEINEAWLQKEISEREWFLNELSEHTDESKRISK